MEYYLLSSALFDLNSSVVSYNALKKVSDFSCVCKALLSTAAREPFHSNGRPLLILQTEALLGDEVQEDLQELRLRVVLESVDEWEARWKTLGIKMRLFTVKTTT